VQNINGSLVVMNFAQRRPNTQLTGWLKTATALWRMAATYGFGERENGQMQELCPRQWREHMLRLKQL